MDMDKKTLILIIVCIVVFAFVALSYAGVFNHDETVTVSKVKFKLPEGYKAAGTTKQGYKKITNGLDTIFFTSVNDDNISDHVKNYMNGKISKNRTVTISNFTTDGVFVYKANCSDKSNQYWFVKDGKTYTFFTNKETYKIDDIARQLILSSKQ